MNERIIMSGDEVEEISDEEFGKLVEILLDLMEAHGVETVRDAFEQAEEDMQEDLPELQDDVETDDDEDEEETP